MHDAGVENSEHGTANIQMSPVELDWFVLLSRVAKAVVFSLSHATLVRWTMGNILTQRMLLNIAPPPHISIFCDIEFVRYWQ